MSSISKVHLYLGQVCWSLEQAYAPLGSMYCHWGSRCLLHGHRSLGERCLRLGEAAWQTTLLAGCCLGQLVDVPDGQVTRSERARTRFEHRMYAWLSLGSLGSVALHGLIFWLGGALISAAPVAERPPIPIEIVQLDPLPQPTAPPPPRQLPPAQPRPAQPRPAAVRPIAPPPRAARPARASASQPKPPPVPDPAVAPQPKPPPIPDPAVAPPDPAPAIAPGADSLLASGPITAPPVPRFTPLISGIRSGGATTGLPPARTVPPVEGVETPTASSSEPTESGPPLNAEPTGSAIAANPRPDVLAQPIPGQITQPQYPEEARRRGWQGRVSLRARVNEQGIVEEVEVLASSGFPTLDQAALQAVRGWKFSPAKRGNTPIGSWVSVPVQFSLR